MAQYQVARPSLYVADRKEAVQAELVLVLQALLDPVQLPEKKVRLERRKLGAVQLMKQLV